MKYTFWLILILVVLVRYFTFGQSFKDGEVLKIKGTLFSEPTKSFGKYYFKLHGINIELKTEDEIHYGDFVTVKGIYKDSKLENTSLENKTEYNNIFTSIRKSLLTFYKSSLKEPSASLVAGITIGAKSSLPQNFKNKLNNKGLSHIVVASGTNISIVASFISAILLKKIKRQYALILTIIFIWFYTLISGFEAPIVRASLMATIAFTGVIYGKVVNTFKITLLTAALMLIIFPVWLTDIGFLLSFSTTVSIILFNKKVNNLLKRLPLFIKEDLSTSLSAQIGSTPIILFFFGKFNILSPLYNILILWTVPIIMFFGGISAVFSFIYLPLAKLILLPIIPIVSYFISIVNL